MKDNWPVTRHQQTDLIFLECPVLWKKYYDADNTAWCFRLFSQEKSFEEANDICEEEGAQLASVVSEEQKSFILKDVKIC